MFAGECRWYVVIMGLELDEYRASMQTLEGKRFGVDPLTPREFRPLTLWLPQLLSPEGSIGLQMSDVKSPGSTLSGPIPFT